MNDIIEKAKGAVVKALAFRFPKYPVRFEQVGDETNMLGVGVFAVPAADFMAVQDYVFDLAATGVLPNGWELLPLVRDPVTTLKHYPEILDNWSAPVRYDFVPQDIPVPGYSLRKTPGMPLSQEILSRLTTEMSAWESETAGCACAHVPTQSRSYLALAA